MHPSVDFDAVARALAAGASAVHPAEAHGCLCGALCVRHDYALADWLDEILPDAAAVEDAGPLADLHADSATVLARPDMEFEPLLPDDASTLAARVESLAAWCQGFLYGFGAAGTAGQAELPPHVDEVLEDFAGLAQAGAVGSAEAEVEESAYAELVEYLRAGVQLVYEELGALRARQQASHPGH